MGFPYSALAFIYIGPGKSYTFTSRFIKRFLIISLNLLELHRLDQSALVFANLDCNTETWWKLQRRLRESQ